MADLADILAPERLAAAKAERLQWREELTAHGCLLFGPGGNGRRLAQQIAAASDAPLPAAFVSDVAGDVGRTVEGLSVLSRDEALQRFGPEMPVINCVFRADVTLGAVMRGLRASGFRRVWSLPHASGAFSGSLPPIYGYGGVELLASELERIFAAHDRLSDETSRRIFADLVGLRVSLDFSSERQFDPSIYFPEFLARSALAAPGEPLVFVDCGAYVGDTVEQFSRWRPTPPARVVALEPDPASFAKLQASASRASGIEVTCVQAAAGARNGRVGFLSLGNEASRIAPEEDGAVDMVTVDSLLARLDCRASYIKYDVEGFEREAIQGSREAITREGAALAVSVYHHPNDLWDLLLRLAEMQPGYQFRLREHGPDGVDTVLYAIAPR